MRPDKETNNAFIYCLAEAAARFRIEVLFTAAMANHHHTGIYDPEGNYPAFLEHFHKLFAKCQNALRGRWENFWSSEQTSVVRLVEPGDVLDKMTYAVTNPVKDGLVEKGHHWPGVSSLMSHLRDRPLRARRPRHFFRDEGPMPEVVTLSFARPRGFEHLNADEFATLLSIAFATWRKAPRPNAGAPVPASWDARRSYTSGGPTALRRMNPDAGSVPGSRPEASGAGSKHYCGAGHSVTHTSPPGLDSSKASATSCFPREPTGFVGSSTRSALPARRQPERLRRS
jgi:hypothetical protein